MDERHSGACARGAVAPAAPLAQWRTWRALRAVFWE